MHLLVITLHAETRHFISHAQCVIRTALVSPNFLRQLRSRSRPLIPALLEGAYARQMLVESSSGYRGIAPVWRWPSLTAAEDTGLWRYLYRIESALLPVAAAC